MLTLGSGTLFGSHVLTGKCTSQHKNKHLQNNKTDAATSNYWYGYVSKFCLVWKSLLCESFSLFTLVGNNIRPVPLFLCVCLGDMLDSETMHFTRQMRTPKHGGSVWEIRLGFRVRAGFSSRPSKFVTVKSCFLSVSGGHLHHIYISVLLFWRLSYDPARFSWADVVWPLECFSMEMRDFMHSTEWGRCLAQCFAAFIDTEIQQQYSYKSFLQPSFSVWGRRVCRYGKFAKRCVENYRRKSEDNTVNDAPQLAGAKPDMNLVRGLMRNWMGAEIFLAPSWGDDGTDFLLMSVRKQGSDMAFVFLTGR